MLSEAINQIVDLGRSAKHVQIISDLNSSSRVAIYNPETKAITFEAKDRVPQVHTVTSLESFADAFEIFGDSEGTPSKTTVWISLERLVMVLDTSRESRREDRITMQLTPHPVFSLFNKVDWQTHEKMVNLLRHSLCDCKVDPSYTLEALRSLRFENLQGANSEINATSKAMGKSIASKVTGAAEIPEAVSLEFHPWPSLSEELDVNVLVWFTLFVDPLEQKLKLDPRPGSLEEAKRKSLEALKTHLGEEMQHSPIFLGTP